MGVCHQRTLYRLQRARFAGRDHARCAKFLFGSGRGGKFRKRIEFFGTILCFSCLSARDYPRRGNGRRAFNRLCAGENGAFPFRCAAAHGSETGTFGYGEAQCDGIFGQSGFRHRTQKRHDEKRLRAVAKTPRVKAVSQAHGVLRHF